MIRSEKVAPLDMTDEAQQQAANLPEDGMDWQHLRVRLTWPDGQRIQTEAIIIGCRLAMVDEAYQGAMVTAVICSCNHHFQH